MTDYKPPPKGVYVGGGDAINCGEPARGSGLIFKFSGCGGSGAARWPPPSILLLPSLLAWRVVTPVAVPMVPFHPRVIGDKGQAGEPVVSEGRLYVTGKAIEVFWCFSKALAATVKAREQGFGNCFMFGALKARMRSRNSR